MQHDESSKARVVPVDPYAAIREMSFEGFCLAMALNAAEVERGPCEDSNAPTVRPEAA